ncbi:DNA polymerase III, subunit gamma and tau [uncultured Eubacteriales bacterium]|uniref:DNA-directed DNA polymerase n=1 Tax=uncultured Eubacteriales bacterium TaxID=172733 RepID=A0A212JGQ4_9FIRM|nr:DNA polymerase III, subunit gamma and tau [uncultured Eubacteriales bacterium]
MYQALYRKWRSRTFDEVVGQSHITDTLKRQVDTGRLSHAYLFTGTRGTGKTSCAKILARAVNCEHPVNGNPCNQCPSCRGIEDGSILDVLELDAASNNGVDQVRALRDEAVYSPASVKKRVYIVDEVHMLSTAAFNALLKILEEPPAHLMFILATTELHKVPATIKSRCQQFAFKRILPRDIALHLMYVSDREKLGLTEEGAALLSRLADGGMRDALSLLDQCISASGVIGEAEILDALGMAGNLETAALLEQAAEGRTAQALETLNRLYGAGKDVGTLLGELSSLTRDLLIRRTAPQSGTALLTGGYDETTLRHLSNLLPPQRLTQILTQLQTTQAELPRSSNRRTDAELCLIRVCDSTLDTSAAGLAARLARLEGIVAGNPAALAPVSEAPREVPAPAVQAPVSRPPTVDTPPWEEERAPLPEEPVELVSEPPVRRERPAPPSAAPAAANPGDFWPGLVDSLKGQVPMGEYMFLKKAQGRVEDGVLNLYVGSDFDRAMVNKPAVLTPLSAAADGILGGKHRVAVVVGQAPAVRSTPAPAAPASTADPEPEDKLDDLLAISRQFDNIIIKE